MLPTLYPLPIKTGESTFTLVPFDPILMVPPVPPVWNGGVPPVTDVIGTVTTVPPPV